MKRVNDEDLDGGRDFVYYDGDLFTGTAVDYHSNGQLAAEIDYVNGVTQGWWKEWSITGQLLLESECKGGLRHGVTKAYFEDGSLKLEAQYEFGIETSYTEWDDKGNVRASRVLTPDTPGANYSMLQKFRERNERELRDAEQPK